MIADPIAPPDLVPTSRRLTILQSATRAFSAYGLRGSSLRDIARDAGVSLTLLSHHFGSKAMLLKAAVTAHRESCLRKIAPLRDSLANGPLDAPRLAREWADYEFDLYGTRQGRHDLHLVLRLGADTDVDPALRRDINCSERVVRDALARVMPGRGPAEIRATWVAASAALYAAVLEVEALDAAGEMPDAAAYRRDIVRFLVGAIERSAQA